MALNNVAMMGRLTGDAELKTTESGISVTSFGIAVDRDYRKAGEERQADFFNVVAWRGTAEFISKYFRKGSMIAIKGSLQSRNYEDKIGNKRTAIEIVADSAYFCGSKADSTNNAQSASDEETPAFSQCGANDFSSADMEDEELPF